MEEESSKSEQSVQDFDSEWSEADAVAHTEDSDDNGQLAAGQMANKLNI